MTAPDELTELASIDGHISLQQTACIPVTDDGLLRGDGAFEFVRCYLGRPFKLQEHLDRMERSCALLRLPFPHVQIREEIAALLQALGAKNRDLRIVLTRGGRRILLLYRFPPWEHAQLALIRDEPRLVIGGAKTLSYAGNMLAKRMATDRGFTDALLVRPNGHIMEAQQAAFFWADAAGNLCTPPLSEGILDSITRRVIMTRLSVEERPCHERDAFAASEAFLAGTSREVHPIARIEDRYFADVPGPLTRRAIDAYRAEVASELGLQRRQIDAAAAE